MQTATHLWQELWRTARAEAVGLTCEDFSAALSKIAAKCNYGQPGGAEPNEQQQAAWLRSLHLEELALAVACAKGHEIAWQRFFDLYRAPLTQAAIAMTGSATLGHDLAGSLYSELYGLREVNGERRSPLASYSGRGSLLGWLRTTLAQRFVDHHRRTHRETALDAHQDAALPPRDREPLAAELTVLQQAVVVTLRQSAAEERFLLASYFLDRQPLAQIALVLHVHEATISRRLKRLLSDLRKRLLHQLQAGGLSKRAAEEALGNDPRDLEINLRLLLQTSQSGSFSEKATNV